MKRRRRLARITLDVGTLYRSHIKNRAKRLGISASRLVCNAVLHAKDEDLIR